MIFESGKDHTHTSLHCHNQIWNSFSKCPLFLHVLPLAIHFMCLYSHLFVYIVHLKGVDKLRKYYDVYTTSYTPGKTMAIYSYAFNKQILFASACERSPNCNVNLFLIRSTLYNQFIRWTVCCVRQQQNTRVNWMCGHWSFKCTSLYS